MPTECRAISVGKPVIDTDSLPGEVQSGVTRAPKEQTPAERDVLKDLVGQPLAEVERRLITATLAHCEGNKGKAAGLLGISLKTLYNRLHAYQQENATESAPATAAPQRGDL